MHYLIQLGYVEDSIPGMLCLYYGNPHKTVGEALRSLRNVLREHLTEPKKPCCHKAPKGSNYCPTCGTHAPHLADEPSGSGIMDAAYRLLTTSCDELMGSGLNDAFEEAGWELWSVGDLWGVRPVKDTVMVESLGRWLEEPGLGEYGPGYMSYTLPDGRTWSTLSDEPEPEFQLETPE